MKYKCTCPDFTKSLDAHPNGAYRSLRQNRDWSDSGAGVQGGRCKHIIAVMILRGEYTTIPKDAPVGMAGERKRKPKSENTTWAFDAPKGIKGI
jgi:hypothetical protein